MTDSVDTVDANANKGAIEDAVQTWLDNNSGTITSLDDTETVRTGPDRVVITFLYTA